MPNQSLVEDYHIMINFNKAYIPLSPTRDYGAPVALSGRMFFPASAPLNFSTDARLVWNVNAKTDRTGEKIALKAPNGKYVCAEGGGGKELVANRGAIGDWETFEFNYVDENRVALKAHNGQYVGVDYIVWLLRWNQLVANRDTIGSKETFTLERINDKIALKAYNGKYVCVGCGDGGRFQPKWLFADSSNPVYFDLIELEETDSETTTLAKYKEDFMLTGFSVEESYGSEIGVFYSDDKDRTLEADFVMAYEFLRNTTTHVSDMPSILTANNVTVMSNISSFSHQDEALVELVGNMTPDALDSLPNDMILPILTAFEDNFTSKAMDDLVSGSFTGDTYEVDMRAAPVITMKTMKMTWYNTSTNESLEIDDVLTEIQEWGQAKGLEDDTLATMMGLVLAWDACESTVIRVGSIDTDFDTMGKNDVLDAVNSYGIAGIGAITSSILPIYTVIRTFKMKPTVIAKALNIGRWKLLKSNWKSITKCKVGWVGKLGRLDKALGIIGLIIEIGIALGVLIYFLATSDLSDFEIWYASFYTTMIIAFAVALFLIGLLASGPVGWIIAAIIAVIDIILEIFGVGFSKFVEWFISLFYDIDERSKVELEMKESTLNIDDYDDNSLTKGDRIEFKSRILGKVWVVGPGGWSDLTNSYIIPSYDYSVPPGSVSNASKIFSASPYVYTYPSKKAEYITGVRVKPMSMTNFPLTVWLSSSYRVYYEVTPFPTLVLI